MSISKNSDARLAQYLCANGGRNSLPNHSVDYYDRFTRIDNYLNSKIHPNVNVGATAGDSIWLTDHGPDHIATVIQRAGDLAFTTECVLTRYEAYILLIAVHFHDMGNLFGRQNHERKIHTIMFENLESALVGGDSFEKRMICDIAMAHGGYADEEGDKDTIGTLRYDEPRDKSRGVRVKKLAAILRFADELADDNTRTNRFVQQATAAVYPGSEIFHWYAAQLRPIEIDHDNRSVNLRFELNTTLVNRKFRKNGEETYLYDEILARTLKMYREYIYCKRFMLPDIVLDQIAVHIDVCNDTYSSILGQINYVLVEEGYPEGPRDLREIHPELATGELLKGRVAKLQTEGSPSYSAYTVPPDLLALEG